MRVYACPAGCEGRTEVRDIPEVTYPSATFTCSCGSEMVPEAVVKRIRALEAAVKGLTEDVRELRGQP